MKAPMGKDENNVIASTAMLLNDAMKSSGSPEKVLLRFVRGVMQGHQTWGAYCLGRGTATAMINGGRTCRVCGCTEMDACLTTPASMGVEGGPIPVVPCSWVEDDLCSACIKIDRDLKEEERKKSLKV